MDLLTLQGWVVRGCVVAVVDLGGMLLLHRVSLSMSVLLLLLVSVHAMVLLVLVLPPSWELGDVEVWEGRRLAVLVIWRGG